MIILVYFKTKRIAGRYFYSDYDITIQCRLLFRRSYYNEIKRITLVIPNFSVPLACVVQPLSARPNNYRLSEIALKSGFKFRDIENRKLDWKALGCVDVNKVIENQDYEFLEKITPKIIEAPMQSILGTAAIDPAVSSLFRLAQMSLQYMTFCQQFMSHTLYDLRTAFNHIQKKYSNLKHNYKCLEEQHYRAQERVQSLLKEKNGAEDDKGPSSLFPCDQCTKNFLTLDSLKSHQQRKHTAIGEKHELSDDNEKDVSPKEVINNLSMQSISNIHNNNENNSNNNNNDNEINADCMVCSQKMESKTNSSSIAIQCELNIQQNQNDTKIALNDSKNMDSELIQSAYDTINELKKEIVDLKNSLEAKTCTELPQIESGHPTIADKSENSASLTQTNDKIVVIEQKFNAFEVMYMESQHQFIESFRNIDERQKSYMDNIQETIKEIIEKSLEQNDPSKNTAISSDIMKESISQCQAETIIDFADKPIDVEASEKCRDKKLPELHKIEQCMVANDSSSYSEDDDGGRKLTCEAEVYTISQNEQRNGCDQNDRKETKNHVKSLKKTISKDVALHEFEHRLLQFGVEMDSAGLATPRSYEINQDLVDERKEIGKAHKSFEKTRKQLRNEVDRIAKGKLASASSATSLSSYQSDHTFDESDGDGSRKTTKFSRPKSASVQKMRKRNAKKLVNKFVENDIDENDLIDKMQMAHKAINSHRQSIQQLLETTAHSPSSLAKCKYPSMVGAKMNDDGDNDDSGINQYNKMPNITTRRVVFVNLDEDS
ncbi:cilium assembly protein DZIP1L isoform X2 [Sitodiplosis mosellana]|uniref:cilium assembly protein DZIP1L isoform X2 n=1 Tax=Sitodiplosis mosellana TaxID=263140 RepID=UPI002444768B|nr:cilium assembly protein DZIP1L isoform X2 [Sitodiplosis mosellana]